MAFHMLRLTQKDYVVSQWSGGTTTQIAIAPRGVKSEASRSTVAELSRHRKVRSPTLPPCLTITGSSLP